jgi:putative hemolysin
MLINLDFVGTFMGWSMMKVLRISACNRIYDKHKHLEGLDFINALLEEFEVKFEIPEEDLRRIPKNGAFITVSNHPLGGIDGILLLKILLEQRADYKIIANFLLHRIEPLKPYVMPVNPFENKKDVKSSVSGFKNALKHLQEGHPLGIFPAGEVSTYKEDKRITDRPWEEAAMKLAKKAEVPVVPIYFHAKNSLLFYKLAKLSPTFRTAKLPSELLTQSERTIKIRIGNAISVNDQKEQQNLQDYTAFLRKKTYMLANTFEKKKLLDGLPKKLKLPKPPKKIVTPISEDVLEKEINNIREMDKRLLVSKNYEVFLANAELVPNVLQEIGRLREITFREVGEGTNNDIDLDSFDTYYHHMFLWDNEARKIAGAYRMGLGFQNI